MTTAPISDQGVEEGKSGQLGYLERKADSPTVAVFFHGLGLDALDYLGYLREHDSHGIAVSLAGFAPGSAGTLPPVPLDQHVGMAAEFIERTSRANPGKGIVLVGFSLGADLVLQLAEHWGTHPTQAPPLTAAVLLDPNVNQSTMTISRLFAAADPQDPVPAFKTLVNHAADRGEIISLCNYVARIAGKDFRQLRRLSDDAMAYWSPTGYGQFGARLTQVARLAESARVILSAPYKEHLDHMREAVQRHGDPANVFFRITELEHFGLVGDSVLSDELDTVVHQHV